MSARRFGLRARFLAAGSLLVITTIAATAWTLIVLSRLATVSSTTVRETGATTAATAAMTSAIEREDDALLVILGNGARGHESLADARAVTDQARRALLASGHDQAIGAELDEDLRVYRAAVDALEAAHGPEPLARYHGEVNVALRTTVAVISRIRDQRFEEARQATAHARDEVTRARGIVIVISVLAAGIAALVALRLARHVILPMRRLAAAAKAIRDGDFSARVSTAPRDEIGQVAEAFNAMAQRLGEFHRSNLGEVLRVKGTLEATMRALPDAVVLVDDAGTVVSVNPAAEALFRDAGKGAPTTVDELALLAADAPRFRDALMSQQPLDRVDLDAALRIEGRGEVRRYVPRIVPLVPAGIVLVLSDVTELARFDELRTELVAVASHELRTPVTTLRMSLMLLREQADGLSAPLRDLITTALGGVEQLGQIVDEQLDMTRIEAGKLKLSTERLELARVLPELVDRTRGRADELGLRLSVEVAPGLPAVVADRARLRIVIDNILNNAFKYTPAGGGITVRATAVPGAIRIAVTDTGAGIPEELRPRVFEKFFRVEHHRPGREDAPRGSGIGLYLCREIVELHGGTIRCLAAPEGTGTTIELDLPAT